MLFNRVSIVGIGFFMSLCKRRRIVLASLSIGLLFDLYLSEKRGMRKSSLVIIGINV